MPTLTLSQSPQSRLAKCLAEDCAGLADVEGRSPLDLLIEELHGDPSAKREFAVAARAMIEEEHVEKPPGWWEALERFLVLGIGSMACLGPALENALQSKRASLPRDRAAIYSMLDATGKPPPAAVLAADEQFRESSPMRWLDAMLPRLPTLEEGQYLVLCAIREGNFGVQQFIQRLEEMRSLGNGRLGDWLRKIRSEMPREDLTTYDAVVADAFGIDCAAIKEANAIPPEGDWDRLVFKVLDKIVAQIDSHPYRTEKLVAARPRQPLLRGGDRALNIARIRQTKQLSELVAIQ